MIRVLVWKLVLLAGLLGMLICAGCVLAFGYDYDGRFVMAAAVFSVALIRLLALDLEGHEV